MFSFTKQERMVLSLFVCIVILGSLLCAAFKKYPHLNNIVNLIDNDRIIPKINVNTASLDELVAVPYIGEYTAANIIQYRQHHGVFTTLEDIKNVKGIRDKNYERFFKYLTVNRPRRSVWVKNFRKEKEDD